MRTLYKGSKKIGKVAVKAKADTSFVTATAADILSGKKSIDKDYKEITGTMTITDTVEDLTSDANALASEITLNKTAYVKGTKITGTAVRPTPKDFIEGLVESYKVANNNIISAGDFVKFVEEVCGCGNVTTTAPSKLTRVKFGDVESVTSTMLSANRVLLFISMNSEQFVLYGAVMTFNGVDVTFSTFQSFSNQRARTLKLLPLSNERFALVHTQPNSSGLNLLVVTVTDNNVISVTTTTKVVNNVVNNYRVVSLPGDKIFIVYLNSMLVCNAVTVQVTSANTYNTTVATFDKSLVTQNVEIALVNDTTILMTMIKPNANDVHSAIALDITDPTSIKTGIEFGLTDDRGVTVITTGLQSLPNGYVLVAYGIVISGYSRPHIRLLKVDGLSITAGPIYDMTALYANTYIYKLNMLSENTAAVSFIQTNVYILPITISYDDLTLTLGQRYQVNTISNLDITILDTLLYEDNKIAVFFSNEIDTYMAQVELRDGVFSPTLTVYTDEPKTETMVALATGSDTISGISDGYGVGRLYGGDTIDIIRPNV